MAGASRPARSPREGHQKTPAADRAPAPVRRRTRPAPPVEGPLTKARVADALMKTGGLRSVAAAALKVGSVQLAAAFKRWPSLLQVQEEAKESATDGVEWALLKAAKGGEPWAVQFFLRAQGKDRGYGDVHKSEHSADIKVDVTYSTDALAAGHPTTTVTPLPPPARADLPQIEVLEAQVSDVSVSRQETDG